ncbi:MAG: triose-phosphate isomerase [Omnitrophica WOR_2 bacterium]
MRKRIVAGNWKMNKTFTEAEGLLFDIADLLSESRPDKVEVVVCPPSIYLELASDIAQQNDFYSGAQNISHFDLGAYTGEISAEMVKSAGAKYVILGHSERRNYFGETDDIIALKVVKAINNNLTPIYCCGEVLNEREENRHFEVVSAQINQAICHLADHEIRQVVIAYEPVWAIGTGKTATPAQAQEMHQFIRNILAEHYGKDTSDNISILYGGSCNPGNAAELFSQEDVDGGLIGGASLKADDFVKIVNSFGKN